MMAKIEIFFKKIAEQLPAIAAKLHQAGIQQTPKDFVKKTFVSSFYLTTGIYVLFLAVLLKLQVLVWLLYVVYPLIFLLIFFYLLKFPDVQILKKEREIGKEIVFAGRFLIIELQSGISLYDAIRNTAKNYEVLGKYFTEIIHKVDMGTPLEDAINETITTNPSRELRKVLWQIVNSLKTGSDVIISLRSAVDAIVREQTIAVQEYGKKLNPLAMFYMVIGIIVPTLGITMLVVLSTFVSIKIDLTTLILIALAIAFVQLFFISIIKSSRPAVEI